MENIDSSTHRYLEKTLGKITSVEVNAEGEAYSACRLQINNQFIEFRAGKITPKKLGHFVAFWRRDLTRSNTTVPYDIADDFIMLIVSMISPEQSGVFIFSKSALEHLGLISSRTSAGKRGFRLYAPWETGLNNAAQKMRDACAPYFFRMK